MEDQIDKYAHIKAEVEEVTEIGWDAYFEKLRAKQMSCDQLNSLTTKKIDPSNADPTLAQFYDLPDQGDG